MNSMDETVQEFTTWLITFVAIYAVVFLFVRHVLRRFVFPYRKPGNEPHEPSGKPPVDSSREPPELRHASHQADGGAKRSD